MMVPKISAQLLSQSLLTGTFALISIGNAIASEIPTVQVSAVDRQSELLADSTDDSIAKIGGIYPINTLLNPESAPATSNLALARRKKRINTKPQSKKEQIFTQPQIQNTPTTIQPQVPNTPIDNQTQIQSTPTNTQTQIQNTPINTPTQIQNTPTNNQTKIQNSDSSPQQKNLYFGAGAGLFFPSISGTVAITGGTNNPQSGTVNFDTSSAIGYNVFAGLKTFFGRAELEVLGSKNSINKSNATSNGQTASIASTGDITNFAVMLNGYYDISTGSKFVPYIGGGIGYGSTTVTANNDTQSGSGLTYQLKAGAAYTISDNTDIYLQYRYLNNPNITGNAPGANGSTVTGSLNSNSSSIEVGTRYSF
jgi:outer membrane immunogenic protein